MMSSEEPEKTVTIASGIVIQDATAKNFIDLVSISSLCSALVCSFSFILVGSAKYDHIERKRFAAGVQKGRK
jgi:hypothetical protein